MNVEEILTANVEWDKASKEDRTHDEEFMKRLALSIDTEGLLQPIGVRPIPKKPGHFKGIWGRHRHGCFLKILKRESIPAVIVIDMDDEEARLASIAENLWRNPLSKSQQANAIRAWHDNYDKKRLAYEALRAAHGEAAKAAKPKKPKKGEPVQSGPVEAPNNALSEPAPVELPPLPAEAPTNFAQHAAAVMGTSETSVKRSLKIGKAFTPAQFEVIEQQGVNQTWMDTIAALPQEKRDAVINLIASGLSEEESISKVNDTPEVVRADGVAYEVTPTEPGQKAEADLTDSEWVNFHCADTVKLLEDPTAFFAHAILYRSLRDIRQTVKQKAKTVMADMKKQGMYAGLYSVANRFMSYAHPSKWLRCGACNGTGFTQEGVKQKKCEECSGLGFTLRFESK